MNRGLLFGVLLFLMGVQSVVNAQELSVSDIKCYLVHNEKYIGNDGIALYKDGSDLRVELSYYQCNPFMTGFDITPTMNCGSNDELDSVSVSVLPKVPDSYKNTNVLQQWYHVAFTIHGVESRSLYFSCLWFEGQVNLKEQQYIVLRDPGVAVTIGDVDFYIYEAKHFAALYNGKSASGDLAIPSEVSYEGKEYPVKAIMSQAFKGCGTLTSVTIPNSVIAIEYEAFSGCTNLWTINNGLNVEIVRPNAFSGTPWYNNQPDGIVYLGKAVCACKGNLPEGTNLTIKEGTMSISPYAFMSCKGLTSITIPEGVTIIEASTFSSCI